ncbi:YajG family lipoprotein [Halomonas piscis]|uniref:YajG family lipoprotein n=1 Tax=Halomonas piscis TaxID=3031727 RepID=A0ABY9YXU4_9GAMM|nr:YajG family lipoprotein [Halomonas piscis]WNK19281.1 YajG family lipoprotein [Halomonas piscis]
MQRRSFLLSITLLCTGLWLSGCSSPQYLEVTPERSAPVAQVGNGQEVAVFAQDGRDSDVIGQRSGGGMSNSRITVSSHTLIPKLQREAERAVRDMGFTPVSQQAEGRPTLTLELARLNYARADGANPGLDEARLEGVLRAVARNDGTTYTGTYTSSRTQEYALKPGADKNTEMLNALLGKALDRAFNDGELGALLAR